MCKIFKKRITIISFFMLGALMLFGCGNKIKEQMDLAKQYLNSGKYSEAKTELNSILKEDSNNSEAKLLVDIITKFDNAKQDFDNKEFDKANKEISEIPEEYQKYNIKNDIEKLKEDIKKNLDEIKEIDKKINNISKLISDGNLDEAKQQLNQFEKDELNENQKKKIEDLKDSLNKKIDDKKKEEKLLKEKKQKELEQKKKEEENSKKETIKRNTSNRKEKNSNSNANKNQSKPYVYINKELGLQMTIPASWKGLYTIKSDNNGIYLSVKHIKSNPNLKQGFLFAVTKRNKNDDESIMDGVGRKRYVKAKGINYIIWGPTGLTMGEDNPDWNTYIRLVHETYGVAETIKAIS